MNNNTSNNESEFAASSVILYRFLRETPTLTIAIVSAYMAFIGASWLVHGEIITGCLWMLGGMFTAYLVLPVVTEVRDRLLPH